MKKKSTTISTNNMIDILDMANNALEDWNPYTIDSDNPADLINITNSAKNNTIEKPFTILSEKCNIDDSCSDYIEEVANNAVRAQVSTERMFYMYNYQSVFAGAVTRIYSKLRNIGIDVDMSTLHESFDPFPGSVYKDYANRFSPVIINDMILSITATHPTNDIDCIMSAVISPYVELFSNQIIAKFATYVFDLVYVATLGTATSAKFDDLCSKLANEIIMTRDEIYNATMLNVLSDLTYLTDSGPLKISISDNK
jgi:hypothetical protein